MILHRLPGHRCVSLRPGGRSCWRRVEHRGDRCPRCWTDLAASTTVTDRIELAAEPGLPPWTAELLAADPETMVRVLVAERTDVPPSLLARLGTDREAAVRARVAASAGTPDEAILALADDDHPAVVLRLASRPDLSSELIARLLDHGDPRVRGATAVHPRVGPGLQRRLACREQDPRVLTALAGRADLDPVVRSWLVRHPAPVVARAAQSSPLPAGG